MIAILAWYAWSLTRQVKAIESKKASARADARQSIEILIGSYLDAQVDRSECLLRMRVLLDASFPEWLDALDCTHLVTVSDHILAMPYGEARNQLDVQTRQAQDGARRQLLQMHEAELADDLKRVKEWIAS